MTQLTSRVATRVRERGGTDLLRGCSVGVAYALIVAGIAVVLAVLPGHAQQSAVLHTSTNLANLRARPLRVLAASAFVVSSLWGLWQLPLVVLIYGVAQRWVGGRATVFVAVLGHVGATLFVAVLIASGITHGYLARSIATTSDVGISYGLACLAGFVISRIPGHWRALYLVVTAGYLVGPLFLRPDFTNVGHATALALGLGLAFLAARVSAEARLAGAAQQPQS
jgi:hypothetical protein